MSAPAVLALPPGIYNIQIDLAGGITQGVVTPDASGNQFSVADVTTGTEQKFLIDGVGRIRSKQSNGEYAYTAIPSAPGAQVTRSVSDTPWIISVARNNKGGYTGYIMTSDNRDLYWSLNGSNRLNTELEKWGNVTMV
ncbi:hypothetical protein L218DRAFT_947760 [Marasmius fiardii PR-910]|nr:hypothetical protein L218DRAFT_947760 [Marasmius fiardii PR-910]